LRGEIDSDGSLADTIEVINNDRYYESRGVQGHVDYRLTTGALQHELRAGLRVHYDLVQRLHTPTDFIMRDGNMVRAAVQSQNVETYNAAESEVVSLYLMDFITVGDWLINLGVRAETIDAEHVEFLDASANNTRSTDIISPSIGVTYQLGDHWVLLGGVYSGFSPAGAQARHPLQQ